MPIPAYNDQGVWRGISRENQGDVWKALTVTPEEQGQFYSNLLRVLGTQGAQQTNRTMDTLSYNRAPLATKLAAQNQIGYNTLLAGANEMGNLEQFFQGMDAQAIRTLMGQSLQREGMDMQQEMQKWAMWGSLLGGLGQTAGTAAASGAFGGGAAGGAAAVPIIP